MDYYNYYPFIWMFHSRLLSNKINKLQQRCLRIIYSDKKSNFEELLIEDSYVSVRHISIQRLSTEMYKFANETLPEITNCNLRHSSIFIVTSVTVSTMELNLRRI